MATGGNGAIVSLADGAGWTDALISSLRTAMDNAIGTFSVEVDGPTVDELDAAVYTAGQTKAAADGGVEDAKERDDYVPAVTQAEVDTKQLEVNTAQQAWDDAQAALENLATRSVTVDGESTVEVISLDAAQLAILGEGSVTVTADATDDAGNVSPTADASFTLDTIAPDAPSIDSWATDSGKLDDDGITSDNTLTLTVTGESGGTPTLYVDGEVLAEAVLLADLRYRQPFRVPDRRGLPRDWSYDRVRRRPARRGARVPAQRQWSCDRDRRRGA